MADTLQTVTSWLTIVTKHGHIVDVYNTPRVMWRGDTAAYGEMLHHAVCSPSTRAMGMRRSWGGHDSTIVALKSRCDEHQLSEISDRRCYIDLLICCSIPR
jgi:hypothetical protein